MAKNSEIVPTEYEEAVTFCNWLELQKQQGTILDYCHIANESYGGTHADMLRGAKLKRIGRKRGVFDYQIFVQPKKEHKFCDYSYRQVCVELKKQKGGITSHEQKHWRAVYLSSGIPAKICHGADEAIAFVERFTV